jgi:GT2 family glycosyltransferase
MSGDLARAWNYFWSKPSAERAALVRRALHRLGSEGPRAVLRKVRSTSGPPDEASRYLAWCERHTPQGAELERMARSSLQFPFQPRITIVTPVYNTDAKWLDACAASVGAQVYPHWQWCIANDGSTKAETLQALENIAASDARVRVLHAGRNGGISAATNLALSAAEGEYVALVDSDDALLPHALYRMAECLNRPDPRPDVIYSDEDKLDLDGVRCEAYFKPDWSPDLFLSQMFVCHLLMARRELIMQVGAFRSEYDFSQDYDLMLRLMERANRIAHVPDVLYHWRKIPQSGATVGDAKPTAHMAARRAIQDYLDRNGINARIEDTGPPGLHRVRYTLARRPLVSIVVATGSEQSDRSSSTTRAVEANTAYRHIEVIRVQRDRNFTAACINEGVARSSGDQILVLHEDIEPMEPSWLESMLELSEQPEIGAVGAKLYHPHGALRHTGLILGVNGLAASPFEGYNADTAGYFSNANCIRNYSAVSGACLMTRREVFDRVRGFDAALPIDGADIDYCLKVGEAGYRVVFTPYARLRQHDAESSGKPLIDSAALPRLRQRWSARLDDDPFYNPNLSREFADYRVAP